MEGVGLKRRWIAGLFLGGMLAGLAISIVTPVQWYVLRMQLAIYRWQIDREIEANVAAQREAEPEISRECAEAIVKLDATKETTERHISGYLREEGVPNFMTPMEAAHDAIDSWETQHEVAYIACGWGILADGSVLSPEDRKTGRELMKGQY